MENTSEDLFRIQLNQEAALSIQKTYAVARWLMGFGAIAMVINIGLLVLDYFVNDQFLKDDGWATNIRKYILPVFSIIGMFLFIMQLFLYFNFLRKARHAILLKETDIFNQSFHLLYKNSLFALAQFIINILVNLYYFYSYYQLLNRIPV